MRFVRRPIHEGVAIAERDLAALQTENNRNTAAIAAFSGLNPAR